jgi:hypothetical protein
MDGVAAHWHVQQKPLEGLTTMITDDNIVVGTVAVCFVVEQTMRQPSSTNYTREPILARNHTEVSQATQSPCC